MIVKKKISISIVLFLLIILLFPFKKVLVPQWNLKVVDESHIPIADIIITNYWTNYSFPYGKDWIQLPTNESGDVSFPEAYIYTSLGCEIIRFVIELNPLLKLPHIGSTGVSSSISIGGESINVGTDGQEKFDLPNTFVVNRKSAEERTNYLKRMNGNK